MSHALANHFATHAAIRDYRPFSYWPSREPGLFRYIRLSPGAYTGFTLGGHTS
jgi:hypothetical protein